MDIDKQRNLKEGDILYKHPEAHPHHRDSRVDHSDEIEEKTAPPQPAEFGQSPAKKKAAEWMLM